MKRKAVWFGVIVGALSIGVVALFCFGRVRLHDVVKAEIVGEDQRTVLTLTDCEWVAELLDGQWYGERHLSCGTSDSYVVLTCENGITQTLYATFDDCPYVWHAERRRYIQLSQEERDAFRALLNTAIPQGT